jgi:organic radical activating enzyme
MQNEIESGGKLPVTEEFYSLQGEGFNTGKASYFIRLAGCNVKCDFCDIKQAWDVSAAAMTDVEAIIERIIPTKAPNAVITGGEPTIYDLNHLTQSLHRHNIKTFLETSGTLEISGTWDWICLSPKHNLHPLESSLKAANELKVVIEDESDFAFAEYFALQVSGECLLYLQPEWDRRHETTDKIVEYIKKNPQWQISIQSHKYLQIP